MTTMTLFTRTLFVLICCLGGFAAQPVLAAAQEPVEADRIVAVVGDDVITYYELRTRLAAALKQLQKQGTKLPPQDVLEGQMLERLIMDRAQLQFARDSGMKIDDAQLDQAIGRIAARRPLLRMTTAPMATRLRSSIASSSNS